MLTSQSFAIHLYGTQSMNLKIPVQFTESVIMVKMIAIKLVEPKPCFTIGDGKNPSTCTHYLC